MLHNVPLWFVTCLFVVEILYYFLNKLPEWSNIAICIICAIIGDYMIRGGHLSFFRLLPWNIEGAMTAVLFYSIGNLLFRKLSHNTLVEEINKHKVVTIIMIALLTLFLYFSANWNGHITIGSNSLGRNTLIFYCNAFIGIITTITFSILLTMIDTRRSIVKGLFDYLKWFGQNSFFVMASHVPVKGVIIIIVAKLFHTTTINVSNNIKLCIIAFVLTVVIDSIVVFFISMLKKHDESLIKRRIH